MTFSKRRAAQLYKPFLPAKALRQILNLDPEHALAHYDLGCLLAGRTNAARIRPSRAQANQALALQHLEQAMAYAPESAFPPFAIGQIHFDNEHPVKALHYYTLALSLGAAFKEGLPPGAKYRVAIAYDELGDLDEARRYWAEYLRDEPRGEHVEVARAALEATEVVKKLRKVAKP